MLAAAIAKFAKIFPDAPAQIIGDKPYSWQELNALTLKFVAELAKFSGKRILIYVDGRKIDDVAMLAACSYHNFEAIMITSFHSTERTAELARAFNASHAVAAKDNTPCVLFENPQYGGLSASIIEPRLCFLTSGTSGLPKCVTYTWDRICASVEMNERYFSKKWAMGYHLTNFAGMQVFVQCILNGGTLVTPKEWPPSAETLMTVIKHKVDYLNCTPTCIRSLLLSFKTDGTWQPKKITLGGEIVSDQTIALIKNKLPKTGVIHIYASTELGANIVVKDEKEGFPLSLVDDQKIKIVDGELLIKPSQRSMVSYLNAQQQRSLSVVPNPVRFNDGFFATEDLVEIVGDRVKFIGRKDDLINVGGFKVRPAEVENVIRAVPGVLEVAISAKANAVSGNIVKATIVMDMDMELDPQVLRQTIITSCKEKLPYYAVPRMIDFTEALEVTSSYKLKRTKG